MFRLRIGIAVLIAMGVSLSTKLSAEEKVLHTFQRQQLTDVYFSEGAGAGDLNNDGHADIVYGPYWFAGPSFETKHELYPPVPQNRDRYADNFFSWVYDFNGDGWKDVFVVGFPGTPAYVYENPKKAGHDKHWPKHQVFDWVSNESPQLTNLVGDDKPELVCTRDGFFGYCTIDWENPFFETWKFHPISEQIAAKKFGHGLGIGDINGDGRADVIHAKGWFEQPESDPGTKRWIAHEVSFSKAYGGAEMYAYDVDGDGDNDVITSQAAHEFGLSWYEQIQTDGRVTFKEHTIMGSHPSENRYGVLFSELHSVNLADVDGDGLKDIVTGKTYFSHHRQSPMWDAGAVVYWFRLVRGKDGVDWVPYKADGEAGIGRQLTVADVNGDGLLDFVVGGMKGAHVLLHEKKTVDEATWNKAQPKLYQGEKPPSVEGAKALRGPVPKLDEETGKAAEAIEGESLKVKVTSGKALPQDMARFQSSRWSGNSQLWWTGGKPADKLSFKLSAEKASSNLEIVFTCARDYAIVQLALDEEPLGKPIDLYSPDVISSGVLKFEDLELEPGEHTLTIQIAGANPKAVKSYMVGLDYVRLGSVSE